MKITKEILEEGRGSNGKFSDEQLRLFGFTEDNCENWQDKVIGSNSTLFKIKWFIGMKDWVFEDNRNPPKLF